MLITEPGTRPIFYDIFQLHHLFVVCLMNSQRQNVPLVATKVRTFDIHLCVSRQMFKMGGTTYILLLKNCSKTNDQMEYIFKT